MAYIPVSQRTGGTRTSTYTPVAQRGENIIPVAETPTVQPAVVPSIRASSYVPVAQRVDVPPIPVKPPEPGFLSKTGSAIVGAYDKYINQPLANTSLIKGAAEGMNNDPKAGVWADKILKGASSLVGGSSPENLPLGVGEVIKQSKEYINDPASQPITFKDWATGMWKGGVGWGANFATSLAFTPSEAIIKPIYETATGKDFGGLHFDLTSVGLEDYGGPQFNALKRIHNGEDPTAVVIEEGINSVFNLLMLTGLSSKAFSGRPVVVARTTNPLYTVKNPMSSFKLYKEPTPFTQAVSPQMMSRVPAKDMIGVYDPKLPTYFKMTGKASGVTKGEIIQIKPSHVNTFLNKLKSDVTKVPPEQIKVIGTKSVDMKAIENIKSEPITPAVKPVAPPITPAIPVVPPVIGPKIESTPIVAPPVSTEISTSGYTPVALSTPTIPSTVAPVDTIRVAVAQDLHAWTTGGIPGSNKQLPPRTVSYLKSNPIGVDEIPNTGATVTLYRDGPVVSGKPQSYSLTQMDIDQVPVVVPRQNILIKMNSPKVDTLYDESFTQWEKAQGYLEQRDLNKFEKEVIAISPSTKKAISTSGYTPVAQRPETEAIVEETKALGVSGKKPLIAKSQIRTLIKENPEFKENPVLTVDADKSLTFKGDRTSFKIKASALGLKESNLLEGDKITVDKNALSVVGGAPNMRVYKNGNVFASVGDYTDGTPISLGQRESVKEIELPEMVQLAKEIMGSVPKIRTQVSRMFGGRARGVFMPKGGGEIRLRADLFDPKVANIDQVAKVLAHEIGHLVDYLPEKTLLRGNIIGRLNSLRGFRKEIFPEGGVTRASDEVKAEMYELSKLWRPYDEASASLGFVKYRKSGAEVYADFISVLFNDPALAQKVAPAAYNAFFKALDKKPTVMNAYFELQAMLSGDRNSIVTQRRQGVQKMFKEGDIKSIEYQKNLEQQRINNKKSTMAKIKFNLVDNNTMVINRVRELEAKGVKINMDEDPRYLLEERNYMSGLVKYELETNLVPIMDSLTANNISWITFGEALLYERILLGDRSIQANPRGLTPKAVKEMYENLQNNMTPEQVEVLKSGVNNFRSWLGKIVDQAHAAGISKPEAYQNLKANPAYATFQLLDYIEKGITSTIYKSIGTLKDVSNPANASLLKIIATMKATERNKIVRSVKKLIGDDFLPAETYWNGKAKAFKESRDPRYELVTYKDKGVVQGYYVDKYIADSLNNGTIGENNAIMTLISPIHWMNTNLFRPLFIGYNPGFHAFNLMRDFQRFWKNMPGMTLARGLKLYYQAMPVAKARAFGIGKNPSDKAKAAENMLLELEKEKILGITFNDFSLGQTTTDKQIDIILGQTGLGEQAQVKRNIIVRGIRKVLDMISSVGNYIETLPKVAGALELSGGDVTKLNKEQGSFLRKNVGSPDFLTKGYSAPVTNEVFLFSNAITQGMRSDYNVATNPHTRSGYWWKTAKINFLPKILMFMASVGLFGAWMKGQFTKQSEYDKSNYNTIPLGEDENGKAIYLRMPQDPTGQMMSSILWKILGKFDPEKDTKLGEDLSDIFNFMGGQVPGLTPSISVPLDIKEYISGRNPYDSFRGRPVLSDKLFEANNWETDKAFLGYIFSQVGGNVVYNFTANNQAPTQKSTSEEIVKLPIVSNLVGRFIKVSDYGTTEKLNKVKETDQSEAAAESLENEKLVNKYVAKALDVENLSESEKNRIAQEMVAEKYGGRPTNSDDVDKAKTLIKNFKMMLIKGGSGSEIDALVSAKSNKEKTALLKEIKKLMPEDKYTVLLQFVGRNGIVSQEVLNKMRREE